MRNRAIALLLSLPCLLAARGHDRSDAATAADTPGRGAMSIRHALSAIDHAARSGDLTAQHAGLVALARLQSEQGLHAHAIRTAERARDIATTLGDARAMAESLGCIVRAYRSDRRHDQAIATARNITALALGGRDPEAIHAAQALLADQLIAAGRTGEAATLVHAMHNDPQFQEDPLRHALTRLRLGMISLAKGHAEDALAHLGLAAPLVDAQGTAEERFELALGLARAHARTGDGAALARHLRQAEQLLPQVDREENRSRVQDMRIELAVAQERWPEALALMRAVRHREDSLHSARMRTHYAGIQVMDDLGRASERNADLSARNRQHEAIIADQRMRNRLLAGAAALLCLVTMATALLARHMLRLNRRLKLKTRLVRRQGQEISAKNMELKQQNMRLSEALMNEEEKEMLIKEIHHRVKNDLQVVDSLLSIEGAACPDPLVQARFTEAQGRIRSMALVHDHIYRHNGPGNGSLEQHLEELARNVLAMFDVHDRISVTVSSDRKCFPEDVQMPLTLLVNELLTNSLKHSFPDDAAGHVRIRMHTTEAGHELVYSDSGAPWTACDVPAERSFGLQLIGVLAEQLEGTIERTHAGGNVFRMRFGQVAAMRRAS